MTPLSFVRAKQRHWALRRGLAVDKNGYCATVSKNLFSPMSAEVIRQFNAADGGELKPSANHPPKMCALHSSSALAVNVFNYWHSKDKGPLARAMKIPSNGIESMFFERLSPIEEHVDKTLFPKDPNIDVVFGYRRNAISEVGVESKFSEACGSHDGLKSAYLKNTSLWSELPNSREYAESVVAPRRVDGLNSPQLLKHLLGLKHRSGIKNFRLLYLWYATPGPELGQHYQQLETFKTILAKDNVRFDFLTYQELICRLCKSLPSEHSAYVEYLAERYL